MEMSKLEKLISFGLFVNTIVVCHFKMSRFLTIIFLLLAFADTSFGQKPKPTKKKPVQTEQAAKPFLFNLQDSAARDSLVKLYGADILDEIDRYLYDTTLRKTFGTPSFWDAGEFVSTAITLKIPQKPLGWTSDYERIFTPAQVDTLNTMIAKFEEETTNEIAVVTIDSTWITRGRFDSLVISIANQWGVGKKEKNNGVVIGLSAGLRRIRISNGYGVEAKLTDSETKKIIDETIIPYFKKSNYFEGVRQGLLAIMQRLR